MRKAKVFVIAALAAVLTVLPLSASADPMTMTGPADSAPETIQVKVGADAIDHRWPGACRHASMWVQAETGIRDAPSIHARIIGTMPAGLWSCRLFKAGNEEYNGCRNSKNTGWILVAHPELGYPYQGWIISNCTADPIIPPIP